MCFHLYCCESGITKLHSYAVSPELDGIANQNIATVFIDEQDGRQTLKREILIHVQILLLSSGLCFRKTFKIQVQEIREKKFPLIYTYATGGHTYLLLFPCLCSLNTQESFQRAAEPAGSTVHCCSLSSVFLLSSSFRYRQTCSCLVSQFMQLN